MVAAAQDPSAAPQHEAGGERAAKHVPLATYRLQFNHTFTFEDARTLLPYLQALGVSDVYASPYLKACPGSMHGYDTIDHGQLNPEIGSKSDYDRFVAALHRHGLRQVLDTVPNHMGIGCGNEWWQDVLESGPASPYADFFDIDWQPPRLEMRNRVLLPVLGDQFGRVLDRGELKLHFQDGAFSVHYYEHNFPISPDSYALVLVPVLERLQRTLADDDPALLELQSILTAISHLPSRDETDPEARAAGRRERLVVRRRLQALAAQAPVVWRAINAVVRTLNGRRGDPDSFDRLAELLDQQAYRLSSWRVAAEEINYRRFFDINSLAALRMERPEVFEQTHRLVLQLLADGKVDGLRVDHPDGLQDPERYLRQLQRAYRDALAERSRSSDKGSPPAECEAPLYVVVEKILGHGERLPDEWPADGTTGYDFLNALNGIYIDAANKKAFDSFYRTFTGLRTTYRTLVYESKKLILHAVLASELNVLALQLSRVAANDRHYRDFTLNALTAALVEVIACFPIYRTYINPAEGRITQRDRLYVNIAVSRARALNPVTDPSVFQFIEDTLTLGTVDEDGNPRPTTEAVSDFVFRFQQLCSPVMAKGVEDTAFYRFTRLVSLNEVGGDPDQFGVSLSAFHRQNAERQARWPGSMLATSTHDTKRSEDVRARINVLSEIPSAWQAVVRRWSRINRRARVRARAGTMPDRNDEYLLYQTLVGAWPLELLDGGETAGYPAFVERIQAYMEKAIREAKVHTSWINPNAAYEQGLRDFVAAALADPAHSDFVREALPFVRRIACYGMTNSLSQTLLKLTCPGVPDTYQGTELWDFSLVDPDNRRPVDFALRGRLLDELRRSACAASDLGAYAGELLGTMEDGRIKLWVTHRALTFRAAHRELFGASASYVPLEAQGERAENTVAFLRRSGDQTLLVVAPRLVTRLTKEGEPPLGDVWRDTAIEVKGEQPGRQFRDALTDATSTLEARDGAAVLPLSRALATLPVAMLERLDG